VETAVKAPAGAAQAYETGRCACGCGRPPQIKGLFKQCYNRWAYHGYPDVLPLLALQGDRRGKPGRLARFTALRESGLNITQAARELGVHTRTGIRYERARKAGQP
jgi:hypothetical protein